MCMKEALTWAGDSLMVDHMLHMVKEMQEEQEKGRKEEGTKC